MRAVEYLDFQSPFKHVRLHKLTKVLHIASIAKPAHNHGTGAPKEDITLAANNGSDIDSGEGRATRVPTNGGVPGLQDDFSYPPGGEDHLGHSRSHSEDDDEHFATQMTGLFKIGRAHV